MHLRRKYFMKNTINWRKFGNASKSGCVHETKRLQPTDNIVFQTLLSESRGSPTFKLCIPDPFCSNIEENNLNVKYKDKSDYRPECWYQTSTQFSGSSFGFLQKLSSSIHLAIVIVYIIIYMCEQTLNCTAIKTGIALVLN